MRQIIILLFLLIAACSSPVQDTVPQSDFDKLVNYYADVLCSGASPNQADSEQFAAKNDLTMQEVQTLSEQFSGTIQDASIEAAMQQCPEDFDVQDLLPARCTSPAALPCQDWEVTEKEVHFTLENMRGQAITIGTLSDNCVASSSEVAFRDSVRITCPNTGGESLEITISYSTASGQESGDVGVYW